MTTAQVVQVPAPEEILRAADEGGVEYAGGQLLEKPVSNISSAVARRISTLLGLEADRTGFAEVFESSMGYQCFPEEPAKFRKPDVSVVTAARMNALPPEVGLLPIPADLAVEVISPNDLAFNVLEKVDEYLNAGFKVIWMVEPPTKKVTIYRLDGTLARLGADQQITGEGFLPEFKCRVSEFFRIPGRA
jgi:Uma2 family endonuclease